MQKIPFTEKSIAGLKPPKSGRIRILDQKTPGLHITLQASGFMGYGWYRKCGARSRYLGIGSCSEISLQQARDCAEQWNAKLLQWKTERFPTPDPFDKPTSEDETPTFQQLVNAYIQRQVVPLANSPVRAEYDVRLLVGTHLKGWLTRPIDCITVSNVLQVKNDLGEKHIAANRAIQFVRRLFNWSAGKKDGRVNFWTVENPAAQVSLYPEEPRKRFLQPDELCRFNEQLQAPETNTDLKDFLTLALVTGARRSDVLSMQWKNILWERECWEVPHPKCEPYTVQLLPAALAILERRRQEVPTSSKYIFPGPGKSGHLRDLKKSWTAFRKRAGIPDVHVHDLRRTCGSYQAISGVSLQTIGASLGHKSLQSTKVYSHLIDSSVRQARESGQQAMQEMMEKALKRLPARSVPTAPRSSKRLLAAGGN